MSHVALNVPIAKEFAFGFQNDATFLCACIHASEFKVTHRGMTWSSSTWRMEHKEY